jgi:hypothetical protein
MKSTVYHNYLPFYHNERYAEVPFGPESPIPCAEEPERLGSSHSRLWPLTPPHPPG